jgi:DNA-binding winged helix-turn-helix (wHTH) protein/tetratricopeptide (TPR) repeat protein
MARFFYRFGTCSVDPGARELRRAGELLVLSPKVFDCLAYLIEHRDRAVGRDELIAAVWGRLDVTDALLGQAMLKARRAVADTGDEQNAIRTIPRFGYRWVADVIVERLPDLPRRADVDPRNPLPAAEPVAGAERSKDVAPSGHRADARPARHRRMWLAGAATVVAFALALTWFALGRHIPTSARSPASTPREGIDVTVVLPVIVEADPQWSWLRLGLMDLVAVRLRSAGMTVVPSDNVVALLRAPGADAEATADEVRTATGAQRVVIPKATHTAAGWLVHFNVRADGAELEVESRDADAMVAARDAARQLLNRLGKAAPDDRMDPVPLAAILQQAEAALLTDDLDTARHIIEAAPAALRDSPELRLRLAQVDLRAGRMADARARLDRLLLDVTAEADPVLRARVLTAVGTAAVHTGDVAGALRACADAITLFANRNEPGALGRAYTGCGIAKGSSGDFDGAASDFAQARVALQITGDALASARVEGNEGMLEVARGHYADGVAIARRSEERYRRFGARNELIVSIRNQVDAHLALLQPSEALATSERGWLELPRLENADMRRDLQLQHARALAANGRIGEAAALLTTVANAATPGQDQALLGQARATQARLELESGRADAAMAHAREAVAALVNPEDARERAMAWLTLVRALQATHAADATTEMQRFTTWSATMTIVAAVAVHAALAEAESLWAVRPADAAGAYERALHAAETAGVPADIVAVAVSWSSVLIDNGELEHASAVVGRIARWAGADFAASVAQARLYRSLGQDDAWRAALERARKLAGERPIPPSASQAVPRL